MKNSNFVLQNKKLMVLGGVLIILFIVLIALVSKGNNQSGQQPSTNNQQVSVTDNARNPANRIAKNPTAPPQIAFANWSDSNKPVNLPQSLKTYTLKQSFTLAEASAIAKRLGADDTISQNNTIITSYSVRDTQPKAEASFFIFNTISGEYSYRSTVGTALPAGSTLEDKVYALLRSYNYYDPTIKVTATYKNRSKPGVLYIEAHRDWTSAGSPILNSVGLLNVDEKQPLSSLTVHSKLPTTPQDADIYATSDNKDGYARDTDFNSVTLAVDEAKQAVVMIQSNIRPIASVGNSSTLISYDQALTALKNKNYAFVLTTPSGDGPAIDWEKIYPQNTASANNAIITESTIVYLEDSPSVAQPKLVPHYIFRGKAQLTSGYGVLFTAAVPAVPAITQAKKSLFSFIKPVEAQTTDPGQKQGTFDFGNSPTPPVNSPQTTPQPQEQSACKPAVYELSPVYQSNGMTFGMAHYTYWKGDYRTSNKGFWYYVPQTGLTASLVEGNLDAIINALQSVVTDADIRSNEEKIRYDIEHNIGNTGGMMQLEQNQATITPTPEPQVTMHTNPQDDAGQKQATFYVPGSSSEDAITVNPINNILLKYTGGCPIRLTGGSPSLFVYAPTGSVYNIHTAATLTYADPVAQDNIWSVVVNGLNDLSVNGVDRKFVYYEYDKKPFTKPANGWNVAKKDLTAWVNAYLAIKLGLNTVETERVAFEIQHAAAKVKGANLFIGMIDRAEVDAAAPLTVSPVPASVVRIHFYVDQASSTVQAPALSAIERTSSQIIEFGSYSK